MGPTMSLPYDVAGGLAACSSTTQARSATSTSETWLTSGQRPLRWPVCFPRSEHRNEWQQHATGKTSLSGRDNRGCEVRRSGARNHYRVGCGGRHFRGLGWRRRRFSIRRSRRKSRNPQEHISDDLPVPQVVKENLEVIKLQQEGGSIAKRDG